MPVGRRADFVLAGKPFMLARGQFKGRAWSRTGRSDTPGQRTSEDAKYGVLPDELDHPEVWDDWSGGFGHAYRRPENQNTYHWAENFDARFPRQLVHCQAPRLLSDVASSAVALAANIYRLFDSPWTPGFDLFPYGGPAVVLLGNSIAGWVRPLSATTLATMNNANIMTSTVPGVAYDGRGIALQNWMYLPVKGTASLAPTQACAFSIDRPNGALGGSDWMYAQGFRVIGNRVWRYGANYLSQRSTNWVQSCPVSMDLQATANWSATLAAGNGVDAVHEIASFEDQLALGAPDGLYMGDQSGSFVNVLSELSDQKHVDNCRDVVAFNGSLVTQHITGIYQYQANEYQGFVRRIGPPVSQRSLVQGRVRCLQARGGWLYAGLHTGSLSWLLAGEERASGWFWHCLQRLPHVTKVQSLHVDGIATNSGGQMIPNRFWAATSASIEPSGTAPLYWWPIPANDCNPLAPNAAFSPNYVGSARIDLGAVDWQAPGTPKLFRAVELWADNLASAAQWADVYYTIDNGTRTKLGTVAKSPKDTLYFPAAEGSFLTGQSIELSLESFTASAAITPVYRALVLRGALQPRSVDLITAVVRIADGIRDRQGAEMRSGATMLQELRDLGNPDVNGLQAHQLIDLAGATQYVKVLGRIEEQETYQGGEEAPEIAATLRMAVLSFSGS